MLVVHIELVQDPICTMCWLGYRQLRCALALANDQGLAIEPHFRFLPFQLRPELTRDRSLDRWALAVKKNGGDETLTKELLAVAEDWGREVGIEFKWGGRLRQTTDVHRLLAKALEIKGEEAHIALAERLYRAALEEEIDIGDRDYLATLLVELDILSRTETEAFLESEEGVNEYLVGLRKATVRGVEGVPVITFNGELSVDGAQGTEAFLQVLRKLAGADETTTLADAPGSATCGL